jgi:hypothetical protein
MNINYRNVFTVISSLAIMLMAFNTSNAQTAFNENKIGHVYTISVPDYMTKTTGLNAAASAQYQGLTKSAATLVIDESKESLELESLKFSSAQEYYDYLMKTFLQDKEDRYISKSKTFKVGDVTFVQAEASCYLTEQKTKIFYLETIAETPTYFYQIMSYTWGDKEDYEKVKKDLEKIAASLKEGRCN